MYRQGAKVKVPALVHMPHKNFHAIISVMHFCRIVQTAIQLQKRQKQQKRVQSSDIS